MHAMGVRELRQVLNAANVNVRPGAKKDELLALVQDLQAKAPPA